MARPSGGPLIISADTPIYRNMPINAVEPMQDDDIATIMRALGHPVRLNILRIIARQQRGECCCADVTESLTLAQSTVSQHIKVLLDAGLIDRKARGTRNCYIVQRERLEALGSAYTGMLAGLGPTTPKLEAEPA
jgi:ArsR family transcriptional regulator, arsenate/arsenite/antimonite-responsive transcriptional repressor